MFSYHYQNKMYFEDLLGRIIIVLLFFGGSITLFTLGLKFSGVLKPPKINPKKWSKTTAKTAGTKSVTTKAIGKQSSEYVQFTETAIVYRVDDVEYKKYVRHLPENPSHIRIYYKNKNPNHFKLESEVKSTANPSKASGFFLCFLGACLFICGSIIMSELI